MPKLRVQAISMSLDGYVAGPSQSESDPLGINGRRLHEWMMDTRTLRSQMGLTGGTTGIDDEIVSDESVEIGATIMGRNTFGPIRGPWPDVDWRGWWGEDPPFHCPIFVLTNYERPSFDAEGGTSFHFVTDGIESALRHAQNAAGDKDVSLMGGDTVRQYLAADLIDEMHIVVVPILLGDGSRLFSGSDYPLDWEVTSNVASDEVSHVRLTRRRS
ncbi:MAG: dihydrofolate reductase family protein [Acidimicrobiales bacterium]|jgi:dihydrofolate reductase